MPKINRPSSDALTEEITSALRGDVSRILDRWLRHPTEAIDLNGEIVSSRTEDGSSASSEVIGELASLLARCDYLDVDQEVVRIKPEAQNRLRIVFEAIDALLDKRLHTVRTDEPARAPEAHEQAGGLLDGIDEELARLRAKPGERKT
jgi:hypothetical protein